jgi:ElaB/YqjD/DUF883 family membrane-anchored ribosome-binding protein
VVVEMVKILNPEFEEMLKSEFPKRFEEVRGQIEAAVQRIRSGREFDIDSVEESLKKHPLACAAATFVGGLLLGALLSRRR